MIPETQIPSAPMQKKDSWWDVVRFILITAAIVLPIRFFVVQPFMVSGPSMEPNFMNNDYLLVDELTYRFEKPQRGDVIIFMQKAENKYLIKRVIGLPGETVILSGNTITIKNAAHPDGFNIDESFLTYTFSEPPKMIVLDSDHYFVLGDNRPVSYDSRYWGPLAAEEILGRPLLRLFPFNKIGLFPGKANL